jgi:protoporphyrinogen oxidase
VDATAIKVHRDGNRITGVEYRTRGGGRQTVMADEYVSTIPVTAMAKSVEPSPPVEVVDAINSLDYVAIVFVYLKIDKPKVSPDNWLYLPQKDLTVHRISEFKNFSPHCAPEGKTLVCAEITCRVGDRIWKSDPATLREIAIQDLSSVGLIREDEVLDSFSKKIPFAYPIYDLTYGDHLRTIMEFVHSLENIWSGGRQGLFRYNNMDQSIEMGRRMADTLARGTIVDHEAVATGDELFEYGARAKGQATP